MSFGGGGSPKPPKPTPPPPTDITPEVTAAADDERRRLKLAKGRAASNITGGLLKTNTMNLKDVLG